MTPAFYKELSKERFFKIEIYEGINYCGTVAIDGNRKFSLKKARSMFGHYLSLNNGLNYKLVEI